jgi:hypothetical protein
MLATLNHMNQHVAPGAAIWPLYLATGFFFVTDNTVMHGYAPELPVRKSMWHKHGVVCKHVRVK